MPAIKVAVVQACTEKYGTEDSLDLTLAKLDRLATSAVEKDEAQLILFPEAFLGGFPLCVTYSAVEFADRREAFLRYFKGAVEVPSDTTSRVELIARRLDVFLVVPVIERDNGTLYCCVLFFHPAKGLIGKRRKLVPTAFERLMWGQGGKDTLPLVKESFAPTNDAKSVDIKMGAVICWENYMPLLRTYYYSKGIQIYLAPTMEDDTTWEASMVHIALEGRCHVLSACQFARQRDFPSDHELPPGRPRYSEDIIFRGGSMIVSPSGEVLAGPLRGEEGTLTALIELDEQIMGKFDLDSVGHYSRGDIFQLIARDVPETHSTT